MRTFPAALLLAATLGGCATATPTDADAALAFIVVRHAEKADASRDPPLSRDGHARARQLAERLAATPLVAAYATQYQRTRQTAQPAADAQRVPVTRYDAGIPAADFARQLRAVHARGNVLVVGHSNTAPEIAAALCGCAVAPMDDAEYGRYLLIRIGADGRATLEVSRFGDAPVRTASDRPR
jgi:phosphohistidine phosphatase SixA